MSGKKFDYDTWYIESSAERLEKIHQYGMQHGLESVVYKVDGAALLFLSDSSSTGLDPELVAQILDRQALTAREGVINNCYPIAARAVHDQIATGAAHTREGASEFVGYGNHSLNIQQLPDGRIMSFDLTAAHDIDHLRGNFDVLAIGAEDAETLMQRLNELYGGSWELIPREETEMSYYLEYGTHDERMKALADMSTLYESERAAGNT